MKNVIPVDGAQSPQVHSAEAPSAWVVRWSPLVAPGGSVLDVACGHGRHTVWFSSLGHRVVAVDREPAVIDATRLHAPACEARVADLETGPWPFGGRTFDAVVVTNYLWRPLFPALLASLSPGGVLIYETFTVGQASIGKPSRPEFLLRPGELLDLCRDLRIVAFEDGFQPAEPPGSGRFVQRIVAVRAPPVDASASPSSASGSSPARYRLT